MPAALLLIAAFPSMRPGRAIRRPVIRWAATVSSSILSSFGPRRPLCVGWVLISVLSCSTTWGMRFRRLPRSGPVLSAPSSPTAIPAAMFPCRTPPTTPRHLRFQRLLSCCGAGSAISHAHWTVTGRLQLQPESAHLSCDLRLHDGVYGSQPARRSGRSLQLFLQHWTEFLMFESDSGLAIAGASPVDCGLSRRAIGSVVSGRRKPRRTTGATQGAVVLDHVVAVINGSVILQSDVQEEMRYRRVAAIQRSTAHATRHKERCSVLSIAPSSCNRWRPRRTLTPAYSGGGSTTHQ